MVRNQEEVILQHFAALVRNQKEVILQHFEVLMSNPKKNNSEALCGVYNKPKKLSLHHFAALIRKQKSNSAAVCVVDKKRKIK